MSVLASSVNPANRAMSPITTYPQSGGVGLEQSNNFHSKRTASPQRISNGYSPAKSSSILSPRKTSKRFFRRPTLERNLLVDPQLQGNEKRKHLHSQPKVEIIYKDCPSESESDKETIVESLKKNFEVQGTTPLRPSSTHSGEWSPSFMSDESVPSTPISQCLDLNMNRVSVGSNISHIDRVVQEIVSTEQTYVAHLEEIIEGYLKKMRRENSPVNEQDIKDLFMNIEEIYEFNKAFLAELEECGEDPVEVAMKFASKEEGFATYTEYCTNYPMSVEVLTKLTQRKETAEFIKYIQVGLGHALPLGSYLLKPVQRILKYHLLLEVIQKHFDKASDTEGYDMVLDALSAMTGVAQHINEMKRQHEVTVHVQEIQSQMSDFEGPDLTTYGHLILEDSFRVHGTRSDRYLFLFEKILLITKRKENGYSCKGTLMLSNMMMLESVPKEPLAFQIIRFNNQKVSYTFSARNPDQKKVWTLELKRLILDSLGATVPKKAKVLILGGENSVRERTDTEASEWEIKKRSGSFDSRPSRGLLPQGSSSRYTGKRRELGRKSDDEGEPRSPTDVYSSDDDKKRVSLQPNQVGTDNNLSESEEPSREEPPETGMTDMDASQSSIPPADWERRLSSQNDTNWNASTMVNESSEEEQEEDPPVEQGKMYVVEDAQGTILGSSDIQPSSVLEEKEIAQENRFVSHNESTQEGNTDSVKVGVPVVRGRSGSYSEGDTLKVSRNCSVTEGGDGQVANELGKLGFARVRSDGPGRVPKRTSSLKLLEARRNAEKSTSALDLRDMDEDSSVVFNDKEITSYVEYSAIQKTVRKVNLAFSDSPTPTEKSPPNELEMRVGQTRYVVESRTLENSPSDKDISVSTSDSSHHSLEEMLASIDRDLEDTRRTISCAQLLESALLIKNESKPFVTRPTESLSRRGRTRIIDFSLNSDDSCYDDREANSSMDKDIHVPVSPCGSAARHKVDSFSVGNRKPRRGVANVSEKSRGEEDKPLNNKEQDLRHNIKTRTKSSHKADVSHENHVEDKGSAGKRVRTNSHSNRRAFELFTDDSHHDENNVFANQENRASSEAKMQVVTPGKTKLPNVYQMARRYSQKVTETTTVENVRMRARNNTREKNSSGTCLSDKEDNADHTPRMKIERVTKVSLNNTPVEAYKIVRRRKRRSGSSRHRSDDVRRSSWSIEKVKPDTEGPRKERPKSVYDMEALEAKLTESMEQIEEDLEPMLMEGLEKDDVVVRGLVQHLVGKFNAQPTNATS